MNGNYVRRLKNTTFLRRTDECAQVCILHHLVGIRFSNMNSESCEQAVATASVADMSTLFRDKVSVLSSCLNYHSNKVMKVRMGGTDPWNKKLIEVMGCPLRSKYSSSLEQARLFK